MSIESRAKAHEIDGFVLLTDVDPDFVIDLKYATTDNFTGQTVYQDDVCILRTGAAIRLAEAQQDFQKMGYRLKVWDAYRPVFAQYRLWEVMPNDDFIANPYCGGSFHSKGGAVDVTLVDGQHNELTMPSGFDDFSGKGARHNPAMSAEARKNMDLLTKVLTDHGFRAINSEWWHYVDRDASQYELIEVDLNPFKQGQPGRLLVGSQYKL